MATSAAQKLATRRYRDKTYDTIGFDVKKGKRDEYKAIATKLGFSLTGFVTTAIEEFIIRYKDEEFIPKPKPELNLPVEQKRLLEAFGKCPEHVKPALRKLIERLAEGNQMAQVEDAKS